jgi:hypothetical protein
MNTSQKTLLVLITSFAAGLSAMAQGFVNLDFESANVPNGTSVNSLIPIASALPGWSGSFSNLTGVTPATQVVYGGLSLGGVELSLIDANTGYGVSPIKGSFSAYLFGGLSPSAEPTSASIYQTGRVPLGTVSLFVDVNEWNGFGVSLGGQTLNLVPIQTFSTYTRYGADVSVFGGVTAQLAFTAPPTSFPNGVLLDNIQFSTQPIPEPASLALLGLGTLALASRRFTRCR